MMRQQSSVWHCLCPSADCSEHTVTQHWQHLDNLRPAHPTVKPAAHDEWPLCICDHYMHLHMTLSIKPSRSHATSNQAAHHTCCRGQAFKAKLAAVAADIPEKEKRSQEDFHSCAVNSKAIILMGHHTTVTTNQQSIITMHHLDHSKWTPSWQQHYCSCDSCTPTCALSPGTALQWRQTSRYSKNWGL